MFSVGSHLQKQYPELFGWKVGVSDYTIFLEWDWSENIVGDKAVFFSIWGYEVQGLGITHGLSRKIWYYISSVFIFVNPCTLYLSTLNNKGHINWFGFFFQMEITYSTKFI